MKAQERREGKLGDSIFDEMRRVLAIQKTAPLDTQFEIHEEGSPKETREAVGSLIIC